MLAQTAKLLTILKLISPHLRPPSIPPPPKGKELLKIPMSEALPKQPKSN